MSEIFFVLYLSTAGIKGPLSYLVSTSLDEACIAASKNPQVIVLKAETLGDVKCFSYFDEDRREYCAATWRGTREIKCQKTIKEIWTEAK